MVEIMVPVSTQAVQTSAHFLGLTPKKWLVYGGVVIVTMAAGYAVYRFVKNRSEEKDQLQEKEVAKILKEVDLRQKKWDADFLAAMMKLAEAKTAEIKTAEAKTAEIKTAETETEWDRREKVLDARQKKLREELSAKVDKMTQKYGSRATATK